MAHNTFESMRCSHLQVHLLEASLEQGTVLLNAKHSDCHSHAPWFCHSIGKETRCREMKTHVPSPWSACRTDPLHANNRNTEHLLGEQTDDITGY